MKKLLTLWACLLLMAALCPGAQYAYSKRGGLFRGRGKADGLGNKAPPFQSRSFSKQGLKWAGAAAAAGVLGGSGTGYGLGFFNRPKYGSAKIYGHETASSEKNPPLYYHEGQRFHNQSHQSALSAATAHRSNIFLTLGHVVSFFITAWLRAI
ncbi:hypothetical protein LDENG_00145150 [Lucifuga dentata]|nr:hypothetical protein LDENG_00145150 [Lucifuga dentata]